MFKLLCDVHTIHGWKSNEENFLGSEHRTVVELARDHMTQPDKYRFIRVLDLRLVKGSVVNILPTNPLVHRLVPTVISSSPCEVPALTFLDLGKLPRKPAVRKKAVKAVKLFGIQVASPDQQPTIKKRVTKRQREFALAA